VHLECVITLKQEDVERIRGESIKIMRLGAHRLTFTVDCQCK
jgi:hypothetical protein